MPDDPRKRNGHEAIVVPMPIERKAPPLIRPPTMPRWATDPDFKRLVADPLLQLIAHANYGTEQTAEHFAQIVVVSKAINKIGEYIEDARDRDEDDAFKSHNEFDPAVLEFRRAIKERVTGTDDPQFNEQRATDFVRSVIVAVQKDKELTTWRRIKGGAGSIAKKLLEKAAWLIVGGLLVYVWHWLSSR